MNKMIMSIMNTIILDMGIIWAGGVTTGGEVSEYGCYQYFNKHQGMALK
jgi:hypothetical protein